MERVFFRRNMIITISGKAGTGKSSVARLLAEKLKLEHFSIGDLMRDIARKRGISLNSLSRIAEKDKTIDRELDKKQVELGKKEDDFVIDSRLGFHFIPNSIKVFLDADFPVRAKRILRDRRSEEDIADMESAVEKIKDREESEAKRYQQYYNIDYHQKSNYSLVIDTTYISIEMVVKKIVEYLKKKGM